MDITFEQADWNVEGASRPPVLGNLRDDFLTTGSVRPQDGTFSQGGKRYTYASVRVFAFEPDIQPYTAITHPGDVYQPLGNFVRGSVGVRVVAQSNVLLLTYSVAHQFTNGRITVLQDPLPSVGSLGDFAIYPNGLNDPHDFYVERATNLPSGGVTEPWTRNNAVFVPHRNTRYLAVGSKVYGLAPQSTKLGPHYFQKFQLEKAIVGSSMPSAYSTARQVRVNINPDRLNYFTNPGFEVDLDDMILGANSSTDVDGGIPDQEAAVELDGGTPADTGSGEFFDGGDPTGSGTANDTLSQDTTSYKYGSTSLKITSAEISPMIAVGWDGGTDLPKGDWMISWYAWSPVGRWCTAVVNWPGGSTSTTPVYVPPGQQKRVYGHFYLPEKANPIVSFQHESSGDQPVGSSVNMDAVLLERGTALQDYFDGSTNEDTMWETGGVVGSTRSYLYRNRAERLAVVKRVLAENVPMGIGVGTPVLGVLANVNSRISSDSGTPVVPPPATPEHIAFGSGPFGSGPFG